MDTLQKILVEEREYSEVNYYFMQEALKYKKKKNTQRIITLNNIITSSQNIGLRDVNVYPTGYYSKMYMDKRHIENALYRLLDQFNDRLISHKDFYETF